MGISDEVLIKHDLKVDDVISWDMIDNILSQEEKFNIKNRMLRILRHRMRTSFELKQRFMRDGYDHKLIDQALEELAQEEILNNDRLIKAFIADNTNINPRGNRHILFELKKKGIPEKKIKEMLAERDEKELCLDYFNRKMKIRSLQNPRERGKAIKHLIGRGFTSSIVFELIDQLSKNEQ